MGRRFLASEVIEQKQATSSTPASQNADFVSYAESILGPVIVIKQRNWHQTLRLRESADEFSPRHQNAAVFKIDRRMLGFWINCATVAVVPGRSAKEIAKISVYRVATKRMEHQFKGDLETAPAQYMIAILDHLKNRKYFTLRGRMTQFMQRRFRSSSQSKLNY